MDKVYRFYDRHASPSVLLEDYFGRYSRSLESSTRQMVGETNEESIFRLMNVDVSQASTLLMTHYCSIDNLTLPVETSNAEKRQRNGCIDVPERILRDTSLETIKVVKTLPKDAFLKLRNRDGISINYRNSELPNGDKGDNSDTVVPNKDFLLYVKVYEPFASQSSLNRITNYNPPFLKLRNVISILGRQSLYHLRPMILCQSDLSIATEASENPKQMPGPMASSVYKSGFFYIDDTFYNDISKSSNIDYSKVIRKWAETRDIGPFKVATMDTRIDSLRVRFGYPWVYQHQGCCEHIIVLSDARLVTETDALSSSAYPRIERIRSTIGRNCIMCGMLNVRWILTDHDRIPHDTSYFCNKCFASYNYTNGKKVGNFKAYSYPCVRTLMPLKTRKNSGT